MIWDACSLCDEIDNCMIVGPEGQEYPVCNMCYYLMKEEEELPCCWRQCESDGFKCLMEAEE